MLYRDLCLLNFGPGPADEVRAKFVIKLWNCYAFFANYAALDGFDPSSPEPVRLRVFLQGGSDALSVVDHHVKVFVKSQASSAETFVAETSFDGLQPHSLFVDVDPALLLEGTNTLTFAALDVAGNRQATQTATVRIDPEASTTASIVASSHSTKAKPRERPVSRSIMTLADETVPNAEKLWFRDWSSNE